MGNVPNGESVIWGKCHMVKISYGEKCHMG